MIGVRSDRDVLLVSVFLVYVRGCILGCMSVVLRVWWCMYVYCTIKKKRKIKHGLYFISEIKL